MLSLRSMVLPAVLAFAAACAEPTGDAAEGAAESTEAALSPRSLRQRTALERARVLGAAEGEMRVDYVPSTAQPDYFGAVEALPFEAVQFEASTAPVTVEVSGDFPSSATVVVTDEHFRVMTVARTSASAEGISEARLRLPSGTGGRFILVRDPLWSKPMAFDVSVTR